MKKATSTKFFLFFAGLLIMTSSIIRGQGSFTTTPDTTANVNEAYTYDVNTSSAATFSLDVSPATMVINSTTGIITWTPTNVNQGGKVTVRATNGGNSILQTYYLYVSDGVSCPANILNYWKFDDAVNTGESAIDNINNQDALALTDMTDTIGKFNSALKFDKLNQTQQYLTVNDVSQYEWLRSSDFSFSLWFKHTGAVGPDNTNDECFLARGEGNDGARIIVGIDGAIQKVIFRVRDNSHLTDTTWNNEIVLRFPNIFTNNAWHHVAAVYDGNSNNGLLVTLNLYVDGVKATVSDWINNDFSFEMASPQNMNIGWFSTYAIENTYAFKGNMDEVAIYNKALSNAEVTQLYNKGLTNPTTPICQTGNYAPLFASTPLTTINEDSPYSYTLVARDFENETVTKSIVIKPSWLSFNATSGVLSGTPRNANVGDTIVTLSITDGHAITNQTFNIHIANTNDAPTITSTAPTAVNEDVLYTYTVVGSDVDAGDVLTYSAPVLPAWLNFNPTTHVLSGTPDNSVLGILPSQQFNVTLRVTDIAASYVEQNIVITVTNINDAPIIQSKAALSTNEDVSLELVFANLTVTDVDNTYPSDFTLTVKNGTNYSYESNVITPAANYHGTISVSFDLSDGQAVVSDNISITVNSVNDPPEFTSTPETSVYQGEFYSYVFSATDADPNTLTYELIIKPVWLSYNAPSHSLGGIPGLSNVGTDSVVIKVNDTFVDVYQRYAINVIDTTTELPVITSTPSNLTKINEVYTYEITATDGDGDDLVFACISKPSWLIFQPLSGLLTGIPTEANIGFHQVHLTVSDGKYTVDQTFSIQVALTSIKDYTVSNNLVTAIYPVPVENNVTFEFNNSSVTTIQILNLSGKLLIQKEIPANEDKAIIDISDLSSNLYIYRVYDDQYIQVGKLIKE